MATATDHDDFDALGLSVENPATAARLAEWAAAYPPADAYEAWLLTQVVAASVRLDHCAAHDSGLRRLLAERARLTWDADCRLAAEDLAARLPRNLARVARALKKTLQGCELLLERWEALAALLRARGSWTDPQRALALDLLGVPPDLRDGPTPLDCDPGSDSDPGATALAVAEREIETLTRLSTSPLAHLDEAERQLAMQGVPVEKSPDWADLKRYEAAVHRRLLWALTELRRHNSALTGDAPPAPPASALVLASRRTPARPGRTRAGGASRLQPRPHPFVRIRPPVLPVPPPRQPPCPPRMSQARTDGQTVVDGPFKASRRS